MYRERYRVIKDDAEQVNGNPGRILIIITLRETR